jgi:hypothetical protein
VRAFTKLAPNVLTSTLCGLSRDRDIQDSCTVRLPEGNHRTSLRIGNGEGMREIARGYNVSRSTISRLT